MLELSFRDTFISIESHMTLYLFLFPYLFLFCILFVHSQLLILPNKPILFHISAAVLKNSYLRIRNLRLPMILQYDLHKLYFFLYVLPCINIHLQYPQFDLYRLQFPDMLPHQFIQLCESFLYVIHENCVFLLLALFVLLFRLLDDLGNQVE